MAARMFRCYCPPLPRNHRRPRCHHDAERVTSRLPVLVPGFSPRTGVRGVAHPRQVSKHSGRPGARGSPGRSRSAQGSEPPRRVSGGGGNSGSSCNPAGVSGGSQQSLGAVEEHRHRIARDYIATRQAALEDQRNRDDEARIARTRQPHPVHPQPSSGPSATSSARARRRASISRRSASAICQVTSQSNRSTIELSSRFPSRVRWGSLPAKMAPAARLSPATLDHQAPRSPGRWTAKCAPGALPVGLGTSGRRRRRLRRRPPPRCPVPVAASLLAVLED